MGQVFQEVHRDLWIGKSILKGRNVIRLYIKVTGDVQGVGYRYFTQRIGEDLGLSGYVRNMPDGSVELEVEGEEDTIESFINQIYKGPRASKVLEIDTENLPPGGETVP